MIIGSKAIILDIEEAKQLLEAVRTRWDIKRIKLLEEKGLLQTVNEFSSVIKDVEETE